MMSKRKRKLPKKKYKCFFDPSFVPCFFVVDPVAPRVDKMAKHVASLAAFAGRFLMSI